jgi:transcriptional regulator with XRE-family HTH domain
MASKSASDLIAELKTWCEAERGRSSRLAEHLGVTRQVISNWLAGRRTPSLDEGLKIQEFLREQHRRRRAEKRSKSEEPEIGGEKAAKEMEFE